MVDQYVTEGRSLFMSRLAVVFVFPLFMTAIRAIRAVILFKRGSVRDKDVSRLLSLEGWQRYARKFTDC